MLSILYKCCCHHYLVSKIERFKYQQSPHYQIIIAKGENMSKKSILGQTCTALIVTGTVVLGVAACDGDGNGHNPNLPDVPGIDSSTLVMNDAMNPCEDFLVSVDISAYEGDLEGGVTADGNTYCETIYAPTDTDRTLECSIETCDIDGVPVFDPGIISVCAYQMNDNGDSEEACQDVEVPTPTDDLTIDIECEQNATHLNKADCVVNDMQNLEGVPPQCEWYSNGDLVETDDCGYTVVMSGENGSNTYSVVLTDPDTEETATDAADLEMEFEEPSFGDHVSSGSPENLAMVTFNDVFKPDGYTTLWQVIDDNFPAEAMGWNYLQDINQIRTVAALPAATDMASLYLEAELCVDYDDDGLDESDTNCASAVVDDF